MATPQPADAKKKIKVEGTLHFNRQSFTPKKTLFAAPTQGLEHIIFNNTGTAKAASTFNLNTKAISEHVANCLKFDGPLAALAICKLKEPIITFPDNPADPSNLVKRTKWQRKYNHAHDQQKWWDENTQKIYNLVMQHSMPEMKTKLLTMDLWAATSTAQDGIRLLKIIHDICHKKDSGTNATTILDLVCMDKEMFLVHQRPTKLLSSNLFKFKGAVDVVESSDGTPWSHPAAAKIVFDKIYGSLPTFALAKASNLSNYQAAVTKAQRQYLVALFFHGLSSKAHRDLKKKVHNDTLMGLDSVPCTYNKVLQLTDQYKSSYQQCQPEDIRGGGIAFVQKGKSVAATAVVAAAVSTDTLTDKKPHPVPGEKDAKGKMLPNSVGKKNCFKR
jgi:hypothetical protein